MEAHGLSRRPGYKSWACARSRCTNPRDPQYAHYAEERGIRMCERYRSVAGAAAWFEDLGEKPRGLTIDRVDNDGHYSCGRCEECQREGWPFNLRWATRSEQQKNQRRPPHSDEHNKKIGDGNRGKVRSPQARKRVSETIKKLWEDPDYRAKSEEAQRNRKPVSGSTRERMSVSARRSWERRRAER
jgi:hypothetical protein